MPSVYLFGAAFALLLGMGEGIFARADANPSPAPVVESIAENTSPLAPQTPPTPDRRRPNVVLIIVDTLRADKLSAYGCPQPTSPALDDLAAQGVRFNQVLAQCSWTRPSIGSLLTSRFPRTLGLYKEENEILNDKFSTLAEILQKQGYATLGFTANPVINPTFNFNQGFDAYIGSDVRFEWMNQTEEGLIRGKIALPAAPRLFDEAIRRIRERKNGNQPVFLQFTLMEVHEWVVQNNPSIDLIEPQYVELFKNLPGGPFVKYLRMVRQVTDRIADFVTQLSALPGWEDTLFLILSDHGEGLNDHPAVQYSQFHGRLLYRSNLMVPWIMFQKGWIPKCPVVNESARLLDVLPTLLDFLQLPIPDDLDGLSLMPLVNGVPMPKPLPEMNVIETAFRQAEKIAVYGPQWEFIQSFKKQPGTMMFELHPRDLKPENGAVTNHYFKQPQAAKSMRSFLDLWEKTHPKAPPTPQKDRLPEDAKEQLEAIGYLH